MKNYFIATLLLFSLLTASCAQSKSDPMSDRIHFTGTTMSNVDYHHGQLAPAIGVHNVQIMRANRAKPESSDGYGWTYNHAPMIAYWNNTFFVEYLSDSISEHIPPCHTLLVRSSDGVNWSRPEVIFPKYKIPDGFKKPGSEVAAKDAIAVMHQRVGFYVSSHNKLLALAYYGIALFPKDDPNDGMGVGRVVREIKEDGSFGPIYFLRFNQSFSEENSNYPFYKNSPDADFVAACDEILGNPLYMMQMVEEADRNDPLIPLKKQYKAFSYYHLPDGRVVSLWKHALTSISADGGKTWAEPVQRALGFVNSNAKIWGQSTSDGKFATVYNPSEYRWPLAVSTSKDGLEYTDLMLVHGEITAMRYGGQYKSYGPQYVRGIQEGNGTPPDGKMWLTYSMNKEDIWVASVPVPICSKAAEHAREVFDEMPDGQETALWNTYDLQWASTRIEKDEEGRKSLTLRDKDPFDYAKAEKIFPASAQFTVTAEIRAGQNDHGTLHMEVQNAKAQPSIRISFNEDGRIYSKSGARYSSLGSYEAGKNYTVKLNVDTKMRYYTVQINSGREVGRIFYAPAASLERVVFRTGVPRLHPTPETPADRYTDLPDANAVDPEACFRIYALETAPAPKPDNNQ